MAWLTHLIWYHGHFLGIEWGVWKVIGWLGNVVFSSRFMVQWYATERLRTQRGDEFGWGDWDCSVA